MGVITVDPIIFGSKLVLSLRKTRHKSDQFQFTAAHFRSPFSASFWQQAQLAEVLRVRREIERKKKQTYNIDSRISIEYRMRIPKKFSCMRFKNIQSINYSSEYSTRQTEREREQQQRKKTQQMQIFYHF